ncbi:MAG: HD domain-containing protein [Oscillospiraceae bacterium]|nr:HD domain-containing protein [Oscillospiraceae bacterium]
MNLNIPAQAVYILKTLQENSHRAYMAGGCVRDALMNRLPQDWDICTSALPGEIKSCFPGERIIETGLKHGTVTLVIGSTHFEITAWRIDGVYGDSRRPDSVEFTDNLHQDLSRRDFTVNAMAWNPDHGLVDFFGGKQDLENKIIRCVGSPCKRFREDSLRIMRALRFSSTLGFEIEENTAKALIQDSALLKKISSERIAAELNKLICGKNTGDVLLRYTSVFCEIIPEIYPMVGFEQNNPYHHLDVWGHTVKSLTHSPALPILRLTMLLHDVAKPLCYAEENGIGRFFAHPKMGAAMAREILARLRYDRVTLDIVSELISLHRDEIPPYEKSIKSLLRQIGSEQLTRLLQIKRADSLGKNPEKHHEMLKKLDSASDIFEKIISSGECFSLKSLAIDGNELLSLGIPKGEQIGLTLNKLLDMVIGGELENEKGVLVKEARFFAENQMILMQNPGHLPAQ